MVRHSYTRIATATHMSTHQRVHICVDTEMVCVRKVTTSGCPAGTTTLPQSGTKPAN